MTKEQLMQFIEVDSEEDKEADYPIRLNHGVMGDSILLLLLET